MADSPQQPAGWDQPCSEAHLAVIADSISDWRAVSPFLGLTEAEESAILGSSPVRIIQVNLCEVHVLYVLGLCSRVQKNRIAHGRGW